MALYKSTFTLLYSESATDWYDDSANHV